MSDAAEVNILIRIECDKASSEDGAVWNIQNVIDEREGYSLGDIGIYEFDGYKDDFPEILMNAVISTLKEKREFERKAMFYSIGLDIIYGGSQLGSASRFFYGYQLPGEEE